MYEEIKMSKHWRSHWHSFQEEAKRENCTVNLCGMKIPLVFQEKGAMDKFLDEPKKNLRTNLVWRYHHECFVFSSAGLKLSLRVNVLFASEDTDMNECFVVVWGYICEWVFCLLLKVPLWMSVVVWRYLCEWVFCCSLKISKWWSGLF